MAGETAADEVDGSASDSFVLRPPLDPAVQRTAAPDPIVEPIVESTTPRTRDLDSAETMPPPSWKTRFENWRLARRRRTVGHAKELPTRAGGFQPIFEDARRRSAECLESVSDLSQADRSQRMTPSKGSTTEMLRSMPDILPETPRSAEECSPCKSPGAFEGGPLVRNGMRFVFGVEFVYRLYPFSKFFGNLPEVQFPSPSTGRAFVLDSTAFRNVSAFNGSWKMEKGGKDLYRAQAAFPQTKKTHHRFDGHIRYLVVITYPTISNISHSFCCMCDRQIDSTAQHFRVVTWTTMYECREQRPWNGEPVRSLRHGPTATDPLQIFCKRGRGNNQEQKMSVKLSSERITAR